MTTETKIDRVNVYQAADGRWYYAAWIAAEHDHNGDIPDAETETEAVATMRAEWPAATVRVVDAAE